MPTYGRPEVALQQAKNVYKQIQEHQKNLTEIDFKFIISINCDNSYPRNEFEKNSDILIHQPINLGSNINIAFGFFQAKQSNYDYLWIIGDDEPIGESAISIISRLIYESDYDFLIGSNLMLGNFTINNSYMDLSNMTGGTPSFISSTIYSCKFNFDDAYCALQYEFTQFPHLVLINRVIERNNKIKINLIPLEALCRVNERVYKFSKVTRNNMGIRDSTIFFGKPLSLLGSNNHNYRAKEIKKWWRNNWHRVSMYYTKYDFRGDILISMSKKYKVLLPLILLSKLHIFRIKNIFDLVIRKNNV
jgi:hypothetical protein